VRDIRGGGVFVWRGGAYFPPLVELAAKRETCRPDSSCHSGIGFRCVQGGPPVPLDEAVVAHEQLIPEPPLPQEPDLDSVIYIPAGGFLMGAPENLVSQDPNQHDDEGPQHVVYLDAFYIDRYEVTQVQYAEFLNVLGDHYVACGGHACAEVGEELGGEMHYAVSQIVLLSNGQYVVQEAIGYENHPMRAVSWYGAQMYCDWRGMRLPTEAEWEKAARGTDGRRYPWGNEWDDRFGIPSDPRPHAVGRETVDVSPYGAVDMLGNVQEWVGDWYNPNYYTFSPADNPKGPEFGTECVLRGGSSVRWGISVRDKLPPITPWTSAGFRCIYELQTPNLEVNQ